MCLQIKSMIEKERKTKTQIREKISPPLDPAVVSAGDLGPPVTGTCQEAFPFSFYIFLMSVVPAPGRSIVVHVQSFFSRFHKSSQNELVSAGGSWWSHNPPCRADPQPYASI